MLRAGKYKNAGETYVANAPSPRDAGGRRLLYGALWDSYTGGVEKARKLPAGSIAQAIDALPEQPAGRRRRPGAAGRWSASWSTR